jgi:iron(II)-dependent oxidoreductase
MSDEKPVYIISDSPEQRAASFNFEEDGGTLSRLIANKENRTPLVIGIYGAWGSGKTTLMETIRRQLKDSPYDDREKYRVCKTVWFQAWKYKNEDEILAALLGTILTTMKQDGFLEWLKGKTEEAVTRLDPLKVIKGLSKLLGGGIDTAQFISDLPYRGKLGFYDTFGDFFRRLLWDYLKWRPQMKVSEKVDDADVALVVFIDDLDRCPSGKIVQVLETIKLFLDEEGCVFVIGAAEDVIERALRPQYGEEDARRFLEKIIQVSFHLPEIPGDQLGPFVKALHGDLGPAVQPYLNLILPAMGKNLRRLKGFLNNLSLRQGILRGRTTPLDLDLLLHWTILEYVSPGLVKDVKRNGHGILLTLQEKIQTLQTKATAGQPWELEEKLVKEIPQSLQVYFRHKELLQILSQFKATAEEIRELITLSQVVKATEEPKTVRSAADLGVMADIPAGPFIYGGDAKKQNEKIEKPYQIDIYPVTNREFAEFIREGGIGRVSTGANPVESGGIKTGLLNPSTGTTKSGIKRITRWWAFPYTRRRLMQSFVARGFPVRRNGSGLQEGPMEECIPGVTNSMPGDATRQRRVSARPHPWPSTPTASAPMGAMTRRGMSGNGQQLIMTKAPMSCAGARGSTFIRTRAARIAAGDIRTTGTSM